MADPFGVLRAPVTPADPDPAFAARLRARLERALDLPEGVAVSDTGASIQPHSAPVAAIRRRGAPAETVDSAPAEARAPRQGDIGYASLQVPDIERAAAFYTAVFGWQYEPSHDPRARQVPTATPHQGLWGGQPRSGLFCSYVVDDAVEAVARVRAAGGQASDPIARPYGLLAECTDDQGTPFAVHQPPRAARGGPDATGPAGVRADRPGLATAGAGVTGPAAGPHDGDLAYVTFEVADSRRARDFYGAVLGWHFVPGRVEDGWQVVGTTPLAGLSGGHAEATTVPMWRVADLAAAVGRVRAAGGTATEPRPEPYGLTSDCADGQRTRFYLGQFPGQ
jgi:predicted enzyme related to lactoylglutathione lyase